MKLYQSLIVLGALVACLACLVQSNDNGNQLAGSPTAAGAQKIQTSHSRKGLKLPKLFDFSKFKSLFKKKYKSLLEEMARKKIFLGRAFRAFLSFISFKHHKSDMYLKINEMSDWTDPEQKSILTRPKSTKEADEINFKDYKKTTKITKSDLEKTPVADIKDIEDNLAQHPELLASTRSKRSLNQNNSKNSRSNLSVDDLIGEPNNQKAGPINTPEMGNVILNSINKMAAPKSFGNFFSNIFGGNNKKPGQETDSDFNFESGSGSGSLDDLPDYSPANLPPTGDGSSASTIFADNNKCPYEKSDLPDEVFVDHREGGCLTEIKTQGHCGGCYVFSTTSLYEWQYCHESGEKNVTFSEQYPLDCGDRLKGMLGCGGGMEFRVGQFYGTYGVETTDKYLYREKSDMCPYSNDEPEENMGSKRLLTLSDGGILYIQPEEIETYLPNTPILMGLGVSANFAEYGSGIDHGTTCSQSNGHSMLMVGSGREDGHEYWLFRNSYGKSWGIDGYYKLNKKATNCLMENGLGWALKPRFGYKTVFDLEPNKKYNEKPIKQRYEDVMMDKPIPKNEFTSQFNLDIFDMF